MQLEGFKYAKATKDVWVNGALRGGRAGGRREEINKVNPKEITKEKRCKDI